MNGLGFAHHFTGAAIGAVIANLERSVIFHLDCRNRTRIHALAILLALFLIDFVHFTSFSELQSEYNRRQMLTKTERRSAGRNEPEATHDSFAKEK